MFQMIATALLSFLTLISFNGCYKEPKIVYVPQKCVIAYTDEPIISNDYKSTNQEVVAKAILNYLEMKKYAEKLLANQKVCE